MVTDSFYEAVKSADLRRVRIMMKDSLLRDPSFRDFSKMERIASQKFEDLYEKHDGRELNMDKNAWNKDYRSTLMVQVISNFSHERVNHLKEVVRYLNPLPEENKEKIHDYKNSVASNREKSNYQKQKEQDIREGNYLGAKYATGAIAGAVVGGTVAAAASVLVASEVVVTTIAGGAAVGAAAGIGIVALGEKDDKENE